MNNDIKLKPLTDIELKILYSVPVIIIDKSFKDYYNNWYNLKNKEIKRKRYERIFKR